jgi:hypothetical protein
VEQSTFTCKLVKRSNLYSQTLISAIFVFIIFNAAYAEQIPDYDNPYSPIFTDKEAYTWTDKVVITIVAPSWNAEKSAIDSIGVDDGHFIKISTGEHFLEPYEFTETDLNSGIFVGEVILTGFSHDADGDGNPDTNPRTFGSGPTNGFLETERENALTISFEFADGVVLTHSAPITWNIGTIKFLEEKYVFDQIATIRTIDQDMNLNPEAIDQIPIEVASNSDIGGITVDALETNEDSGIFEAKITFTQNSVSSGNRLFAMPSDTLYVKYEDRTLPQPYSISDELDIITTSSFESNTPAIERIVAEKPFITNSSGEILDELIINNQVQVVTQIMNTQNFGQNFVYIMQITNENGITTALSWFQGQLSASQKLEISQSWTPTEKGKHAVEIFVWKSLKNPVPISHSVSQTFFVG